MRMNSVNIFESLENLPVSEACFNDILKLIEARMEDSPLFNACNGKYLTREESDAYTNQLEQDKRNYQKEQAKLKRKQVKKSKLIPPHQVPGQQSLF